MLCVIKTAARCATKSRCVKAVVRQKLDVEDEEAVVASETEATAKQQACVSSETRWLAQQGVQRDKESRLSVECNALSASLLVEQIGSCGTSIGNASCPAVSLLLPCKPVLTDSSRKASLGSSM